MPSSDSEASTPCARVTDRDYGQDTITNGGGSGQATIVPSTPSGISLLLAQRRSPPAPFEEPSKEIRKVQQAATFEVAPRDNTPVDQADAESQIQMPVDEETPLLPSTSPAESSRGPSLYYGNRSRSSSPLPRRPWWSWTRRSSPSREELRTGAMGNGYGLLGSTGTGPSSSPCSKKTLGKTQQFREMLVSRVRHVISKEVAVEVGKVALRSIPAVLLGMLLNILDGVSCAYALSSFYALYDLTVSCCLSFRRNDHVSFQ